MNIENFGKMREINHEINEKSIMRQYLQQDSAKKLVKLSVLTVKLFVACLESVLIRNKSYMVESEKVHFLLPLGKYFLKRCKSRYISLGGA